MKFKRGNKIKWFWRGIKQIGLDHSTDWVVRKSVFGHRYFLIPRYCLESGEELRSLCIGIATILERQFLSDDMCQRLDDACTEVSHE